MMLDRQVRIVTKTVQDKVILQIINSGTGISQEVVVGAHPFTATEERT